MPLTASANEQVGATPSVATEEVVPYRAIDPQTTDTLISSATTNLYGYHLVWKVDRSRTPGSVANSLLYLFLPATGSPPSDYKLIQQEAVDLGYHVIGLAYPNSDAVVGICNNPQRELTDDERQACYLSVRMQTLDGVQRTPEYGSVQGADSIDNRLTRLLRYLRDNYSEEGWAGFLDDTGSPKWSRIVVAGHSQGGGNAALIGKLHLVARVVMISSPPDGCFQPSIPPALPGCVDPDGTALGGALWTSRGGFGLPSLTPANRYYGLAHQSEFAITPMRTNWSRLGLDAFGIPVTADPANAPVNYNCSHMLLTSLPPAPNQTGVDSLQDHRLTARDRYTPLANVTSGPPLLRDAWRYLSAVSPGSSNGCRN
jgi:pimeloyl-ACP methyl ester carboxylesterase